MRKRAVSISVAKGTVDTQQAALPVGDGNTDGGAQNRLSELVIDIRQFIRPKPEGNKNATRVFLRAASAVDTSTPFDGTR